MNPTNPLDISGLIERLRTLLKGITPGPWSVEDPMDFELTIVEANKPTYEWRAIASCTLPDGDDDQAFSGREIHANAKLVASAPVAIAEAAEALQYQAIEIERLREAAQPFADSVIIDPNKKRGDRHWAKIGKQTNLDHVIALKVALATASCPLCGEVEVISNCATECPEARATLEMKP